MKRNQMIFTGERKKKKVKKKEMSQCILHLICSQVPGEITWCQEKGSCN